MNSSHSYIGERANQVYFPPGYLENPLPEYDVLYMPDLGPEFLNFSDLAKTSFDLVFTEHARGSVIVGFADYVTEMDPAVGDDRTNLLTMVRDLIKQLKNCTV